MSETVFLISQAAKLAEVESHVLRYWEEELHLPIARNEKGHRYYTRYDIQVFLGIKELKKKGFQLKDIQKVIPSLYENKPEPSKKAVHTKPTDEVTAAAKSAAAKKRESFYSILEKLVASRMQEKGREEERYKRLDKTIRSHQQSRKMIAATMQNEKKRKKGRFQKRKFV